MLYSNCFTISGAQSKRSPSIVSMFRKLPLHAQFAFDCVPFNHSTILYLWIYLYIPLNSAMRMCDCNATNRAIRFEHFISSNRFQLNFPLNCKFNKFHTGTGGLATATAKVTTVRCIHWIEYRMKQIAFHIYLSDSPPEHLCDQTTQTGSANRIDNWCLSTRCWGIATMQRSWNGVSRSMSMNENINNNTSYPSGY